MNKELQNIAIAEIMPKGFLEGHRWLYEGQWIIFDPLNDLNAMHEAEKVLSSFTVYSGCLEGIIQRDGADWCLIFHATAEQRAEAFLRTLKLWVD